MKNKITFAFIYLLIAATLGVMAYGRINPDYVSDHMPMLLVFGGVVL